MGHGKRYRARTVFAKSEGITGAGEGNRTPIASLEGWSFTTKLHPRRQWLSDKRANPERQTDLERVTGFEPLRGPLTRNRAFL